MFIVISEQIKRPMDIPYTIAFNLTTCEGIVMFPYETTCSVCVLINGRNELIAQYKTHEEARLLVDDIIEAMRSGAVVYDCNEKTKISEQKKRPPRR